MHEEEKDRGVVLPTRPCNPVFLMEGFDDVLVAR
jgi:hypothetical protein